MLRVNRLYYGDCLTILQDETASQSVDLIYLDPPFNSNRGYNAIYRDETGRELPDQVDAFCDMWELNHETEQVIRHMPVLMREEGVDDDVVEFWRIWMNALRGTNPQMLAYLAYMVQRLLPMRRILKPTGSLYYHCDPTAGHYVKVMLDGIFSHDNFRNEIVWKRSPSHSDAATLGSVHDTIFHYSRGKRVTWNRIYAPYEDDYIERRYRRRDPDGRRWMDDNLSAKGLSGGGYNYTYRGATSLWRVPLESMEQLDRDDRLHFTATGGIRIKRYLDEMPGVALNDVWTDIPPINSQAKERLGYPTQKPLTLLERIIEASSNPGDVVLDPFAGCATTMEAAQKLGRQWIGIDIAIHAVKRVARVRLEQRMGLIEGQDFTIEGVPRDVEGARDLWKRDTYQFQKWAVEHADGFVTAKRTSDGGIDGRLYFAVPDRRDLQSMVIEVKGGRSVNIADVRALRGVLDNDSALIAGLVVLENPGPQKARNFARFMGEAGTIEILGIAYPRMQVLTVAEIIEGKRFHTPSVAGKNTLEPQLPGIPRQ